MSCMTGELCRPSRVDYPRSSPLHGETCCDQRPSIPAIHPARQSNTASKSASPPCSALRCSPALTFAFASLALSYRACIYCIGLRPHIGLWPFIGLRPHFWASASHRASVLHLLFSGPGPAFTAFGLRTRIYCFQVLTPRIYCFQAYLKSKIDLDSNSSKRYFKEQV
ncbi:hypothetical protein CRG98_021480 [Punica granatum]|uniref:Uncharacterized protein n=1 Tax=Punica granatum TaxID=22663 RepID=A0A2I0JPF2_PUNGR|nr:hypothetical protein CRG98_021480 [Punica granatum]